MGSGAYLASKSEQEIYHAELAREREAIRMNGAEARELLALYYQVKGLPEEDAFHVVDHIARDPEQMLRALAGERLGASEEALSNPLVSATSGALSTAALAGGCGAGGLFLLMDAVSAGASFAADAGFNGRPFRIYKFRTMTTLEDGSVVRQARQGDERVTRAGRVLRRWSLDELPQLLNVLRGEMSLVGPRPHALAHDSEYDQLIASYAVRQKMKPGITGLAQINGCRGETPHVDMMRRRVEYDLQYFDCWSVWVDLKILATTVLQAFIRRDAY